MLNLQSFARAFQKKFSSHLSNYDIRASKVDVALSEVEVFITEMRDLGCGDPDHFAREVADMRDKVTAGRALVQDRNTKLGFNQLKLVKMNARNFAKAAKKIIDDAKKSELVVKKTPEQLTLADGSQVNVYPTDIPGLASMAPEDKAAVMAEIGLKIQRGKDRLQALLDTADPNDLPPPTREDVADLMWMLKGKAQEKVGDPYEKGALTIEDPGNKLRSYLDKCSENYGRASSHLKKEQKKLGGQGRGLDFYEGTLEEGGIADLGLLLPAGMSHMVYQQVETTTVDDQLLYIKMETESARWNPIHKDRDETPEPREQRPGDMMNAIKHLGNLIKSKLGISQGDDEELIGRREKVAESLTKNYVASFDSASSQVKTLLKENLKSKRKVKWLKKEFHIHVHQMLTNIQNLDVAWDQGDGLEIDELTMSNLHEWLRALRLEYGEDAENTAGEQFGGEVTMSLDDLGLDHAPVSVAPNLLPYKNQGNLSQELIDWKALQNITTDQAWSDRFDTALSERVKENTYVSMADLLDVKSMSMNIPIAQLVAWKGTHVTVTATAEFDRLLPDAQEWSEKTLFSTRAQAVVNNQEYARAVQVLTEVADLLLEYNLYDIDSIDEDDFDDLLELSRKCQDIIKRIDDFFHQQNPRVTALIVQVRRYFEPIQTRLLLENLEEAGLV